MNYSIQELEEFLNETTIESSVLSPAADQTLFDISSYPHYEEVISNWYKFFFDPTAEHLLGKLFLNSLIDIINEFDEEFYMDGCRVEREYYTKNGGWIDLLLYRKAEEQNKFESAVIIENKVFAGINNDLEDYYQSIDVNSGQTVGVVLSLNETRIENNNFINITHSRLLESVKRNLGDYFTRSTPKYLQYLQDFITNLEQLAMPVVTPENVRFYFDRAEKIRSLIELRKEAIKFIRNLLRNEVNSKSHWSEMRTYGEGSNFRYLDSEIYCYVYYDQVFEAKKFLFEIWLKGDQTLDVWRKNKGWEIVSEKFAKKMQLTNHDDGNKVWLKLDAKEYGVLDVDNIENFGNFVLDHIEKDWLEFLAEVKEILRNT